MLKKTRLEFISFLLSLYFYPIALFINYLNRRKMRLVVLIYHSVSTQKYNDSYGINVEPLTLQSHIDYLKSKQDILILGKNEWDQLCSGNFKKREGIKTYVLFTFDDGYKNFKDVAIPILAKEEIYSILFCVGMIFKDIKTERNYPLYLENSRIQLLNHFLLKEMVEMSKLNKYFSVGSHSLSHPKNLHILDHEILQQELEESKNILEKSLKIKVDTFSCPHGNFNSNLIERAKKSLYKHVFTSVHCSNYINEKERLPFIINRIEISTFDTLLKFKMKVLGAYDWKMVLQILRNLKMKY